MPSQVLTILLFTSLFVLISGGPSGSFQIHNETPYAFKRIGQVRVQMNKFDFPEDIAANSISKSITIEFSHYLFYANRVAHGSVIYSLVGPGLAFEIRAIHTAGKNQDATDILVYFMNFSNLNTTIIPTNWKQNGVTTFHLAGELGKFHSRTLFEHQATPYLPIVGPINLFNQSDKITKPSS